MPESLNLPRHPRPAPSVPPGLCGGCRHARRVETRGGTVFRLCLRSTADPAYPRYPPLPVFTCRGFEPSVAAELP
jgi:hypothetical protein